MFGGICSLEHTLIGNWNYTCFLSINSAKVFSWIYFPKSFFQPCTELWMFCRGAAWKKENVRVSYSRHFPGSPQENCPKNAGNRPCENIAGKRLEYSLWVSGQVDDDSTLKKVSSQEQEVLVIRDDTGASDWNTEVLQQNLNIMFCTLHAPPPPPPPPPSPER